MTDPPLAPGTGCLLATAVCVPLWLCLAHLAWQAMTP
jgi:hypothetical protein